MSGGPPEPEAVAASLEAVRQTLGDSRLVGNTCTQSRTLGQCTLGQELDFAPGQTRDGKPPRVLCMLC